jgi:hypothetical protein
MNLNFLIWVLFLLIVSATVIYCDMIRKAFVSLVKNRYFLREINTMDRVLSKKTKVNRNLSIGITVVCFSQ